MAKTASQDQQSAQSHTALDFMAWDAAALTAEGRARQAALLMLDTLGVYIAAHPMEAGRIAREAATRLYGATDPKDQARIPLDDRICSRAGMAFAAASQIDNLDGHDGYNPTKGHIGCAVIPALLAEAEGRDISSTESLACLVLGYEIAGRAGIALHNTVTDYHTSGAWNSIGVAAIGARIRGLSNDQLRHAWGISEYHGPRSQMMREIANPTMLHDGSGMGALVGLSAVTLAELGFTGAPAITIEAPDVAEYWNNLGTFWQIDHQYIKPYPTCRWAHAAIDAMHALRTTHVIDPTQIEQIEIRSFHNAIALVGHMPRTTSEAQYALGFNVATMALKGRIGLDQISGDGLTDPATAALLKRIKLVEDPRFEAHYPEGRWAEVEVTLNDGTILNSGETHARGGPERPMPEQELHAKFMEFAAPVLGKPRADQIWTTGLALADGDMPFSAFTDLLSEAP
ncbi:MAG: MmgE/PrpD family protein [Pseudomonadota bacterium]